METETYFLICQPFLTFFSLHSPALLQTALLEVGSIVCLIDTVFYHQRVTSVESWFLLLFRKHNLQILFDKIGKTGRVRIWAPEIDHVTRRPSFRL